MHNPGNYRWRIVVLLFFATTINYIDRQVLGLLAPSLQSEFNWSESDYGLIVASFQAAYAIGLLFSGRIIDRIGTKIGYIAAIFTWSVAGILHAFASGLYSFAAARFLLGLGESANFPAAVKVVSEWFPKKERALATGIFNSGSNIGAIVTPLLIPWIVTHAGWEWGFIITGALGLVWIFCWITVPGNPLKSAKLSPQEAAYILQDGKEDKQPVSWKKIFYYKQTLGISLSFFLTAPIWWFFLYWLPKFLHTGYHIELSGLALPLIIIYVISDIGAIAGGWISSKMVKNGKEAIGARKKTIFGMALLVMPVILVPYVHGLEFVIALIALATFAHQGYASNIFTIISDIFPKKAVGAVTGIGMFSGAIGGIIFSYSVGVILERTGNYNIIFGIAAVAYLVSWSMLKIFVKNNGRVYF